MVQTQYYSHQNKKLITIIRLLDQTEANRLIKCSNSAEVAVNCIYYQPHLNYIDNRNPLPATRAIRLVNLPDLSSLSNHVQGLGIVHGYYEPIMKSESYMSCTAPYPIFILSENQLWAYFNLTI